MWLKSGRIVEWFALNVKQAALSTLLYSIILVASAVSAPSLIILTLIRTSSMLLSIVSSWRLILLRLFKNLRCRLTRTIFGLGWFASLLLATAMMTFFRIHFIDWVARCVCLSMLLLSLIQLHVRQGRPILIERSLALSILFVYVGFIVLVLNKWWPSVQLVSRRRLVGWRGAVAQTSWVGARRLLLLILISELVQRLRATWSMMQRLLCVL